MRQVFVEVWRVMTPTATCWLNVGDSYISNPAKGGSGIYNGRNGYGEGYARAARHGMPPPTLAPKNLAGLPWRLALALQADGFILRSECIWEKPSCMPESVTDRFTRSHEQVFLFAKAPRYYFDALAVREAGSDNPATLMRNLYADTSPINGPKGTQAGIYGISTTTKGDYRGEHVTRNARTVWRITSEALAFQHYAAFPTALVRRCLLAGAPTQVCTQCGKPWVRQLEVVQSWRDGAEDTPQKYGNGNGVNRMLRSHTGREMSRSTYADNGFSPSCTCQAPTRKARVLDMFAGSGTTGLVARELGHDAVCMDLSWPYLHTIARARLGFTALEQWTHGAPPREDVFEDLPLFAGEARR
jgi:DNA modification methylase